MAISARGAAAPLTGAAEVFGQCFARVNQCAGAQTWLRLTGASCWLPVTGSAVVLSTLPTQWRFAPRAVQKTPLLSVRVISTPLVSGNG